MKSLVLLWLSALFAMSSPAITLLRGDPTADHSAAARTEYSDKDAPLGIRLKVFLQWFEVEDPERDMVMRARLVEAGFPADQLQELLHYFENLYNRITDEVDSGIRDIACHDKASDLSADQIRAVFNAIDDLRNGTFEKYVGVASGELAKLGYVDFPDKLRAMRNGFIDVGLEHRATPEQKILEGRKAICRHLKAEESKLF